VPCLTAIADHAAGRYAQAAGVMVLADAAACVVRDLLGSRSMHAAVLKPRRLVSWLEGAPQLLEDVRLGLLEGVAAALNPRQPSPESGMPAEAPGVASRIEWKKGCTRLQREVRGWGRWFVQCACGLPMRLDHMCM
jgi:hypothetical protein